MARNIRKFSVTIFDVSFAYPQDGSIAKTRVMCASNSKQVQRKECAESVGCDKADVMILDSREITETYCIPNVQLAIEAGYIEKVTPDIE